VGSFRQILPNYSYLEYEQWEGRWEVIRGIAISMSPMPGPKHQRVSAALSELFRNELRKINCQDCKVYQPIDYKVDDTTVIQPDLLVVCKPIEAHYLTFAPDVVVEILSPSTALKDRHTKFDIYQHEGVKYYIIIDPDEELFEIYELTAGKYTKKEYAEIMLEDCRFSLDLKACFD